ncbi:MAG: 30S ribosomal protein S15, partial [bacterium]
MALNKENKEDIMQSYKRHDKDTGSPEVQIAVLTERI